MLKLGSLFSGIGGFDLGFERAGFSTLWQVEIDDDCREVLARHFPTAKRFKDVNDVGKNQLASVDCICFGAPCQDVSVAGKRTGLAGKRTGLFYEAARILQELRPAWFVFENVPGLFSSNDGRDFAEVLRVLMVECGYGVSWRVLNSQFFGVAQRRRRVFIVGHLGNPCPSEILFESTGRERNLAPVEETWENLAASITSGTGRVGSQGADDGANIVRQAISSKWSKGSKGSSGPAGDEHHNLVLANCLRESDGHHGRSSPRGDGCDNLVAASLTSGGHPGSNAPGRRREDDENLVAATLPADHRVGTDSTVDNLQVAYALRRDPGGIGQGHNTTYAITENMRNRSQGPGSYVGAEIYSDGMRDFAGLPKGMDSRRYRQLGNAVTVTVAEWIARRIVDYFPHSLR